MAHPFGDKLDSWVNAGIITPSQASAIRTYEARDQDAMPTQVSAAEALGYIGAALALGAVGLVLRGVWQQLLPLGQIGLALAATLIFGASAYLLEDRPSETSKRLTSVLTAVTILSLLATTVLTLSEYVPVQPETQAGVVAVVFALAAGGAYARRPRPLAVLLLFSSGLALIGAALAQPIVPVNVFAAALLFWAYALCWMLLTIGEWVSPRRPALILGAIGSVIALQVARFGSAPLAALLLGLITAAALVWFAMQIHDQIVLAIAAITVFLFVPQLSFLVFADSLGAAGALLVSGLVLVAAAALSGRLRRNPPASTTGASLNESADDEY